MPTRKHMIAIQDLHPSPQELPKKQGKAKPLEKVVESAEPAQEPLRPDEAVVRKGRNAIAKAKAIIASGKEVRISIEATEPLDSLMQRFRDSGCYPTQDLKGIVIFPHLRTQLAKNAQLEKLLEQALDEACKLKGSRVIVRPKRG